MLNINPGSTSSVGEKYILYVKALLDESAALSSKFFELLFTNDE